VKKADRGRRVIDARYYSYTESRRTEEGGNDYKTESGGKLTGNVAEIRGAIDQKAEEYHTPVGRACAGPRGTSLGLLSVVEKTRPGEGEINIRDQRARMHQGSKRSYHLIFSPTSLGRAGNNGFLKLEGGGGKLAIFLFFSPSSGRDSGSAPSRKNDLGRIAGAGPLPVM